MSYQSLAELIGNLQAESIVTWKKKGVSLTQKDFLALVEENHAFNFQLWNAEDRARRDDQGFEFVYRAKREIDHFNQQRNNFMEKMDLWLYDQLKPAPYTNCPVHSETPGMMIDRLSILALKAYHMEAQTQRKDVDNAHTQSCQNKLKTISEQKLQLLSCLTELLNEAATGQRTFRMYHQFKMYNDPKLNPELYSHRTQ